MRLDDCTHCLRPVFTARIAERVEKGASVNLIGGQGQGRGRLLDDLRRLPGEQVLWLSVNMKTCRASHSGFLGQLWEQSGLEGIRPPDFGQLTRRLAKSGRRAVFLLHHFDAILDNPDGDPKYDVRFLNALNALHNRGTALVCVTQRPYNDYVIVSGTKIHRGSTLDLAKEPIPALTLEEIKTELTRLRLPIHEQEQALLATAVNVESHPADLIDLARRHLENQEDEERPFAERLEHWRRELRLQARRVAPGRVLGWRHVVTTWWRATGLGGLLPLSRLAKSAGGLLKTYRRRR